MPAPSQKTKKKKFVKTVSGTKKIFFKRKKSKARCTVTGKVLPGTAAGTSAKARKEKTAKRPSVMFGGMLSGQVRRAVHEEAIKVREKIKTLDDVDLKIRSFVEAAMKKGER